MRQLFEAQPRNRAGRYLSVVIKNLTILNGTTETEIFDQLINTGTFASFTPTSDTSVYPYVASKSKGKLTIAHTDPGVDVTFEVMLVG